MRFERTRDPALVRAVFGRAFPTLESERGLNVFERLAHSYDCVLAYEGGELAGLYMICRQNEALAEIHFALLPHAWGPRGLAVSRAFLDWFWTNTDYERLVGGIDTQNRLAVRYAERLGFALWGVNERAMRKNGEFRDVAMVGMTRGKS